MSETGRCPHGFEIGVYRGYTGAMAAPYSFCECCKTNFYYIDSGNWSAPWAGAEGKTTSETWTHDKDRCPDCGGGITHIITEDGATVLSERVER